MSPSEYQDLMVYLGERFETINQRFETMDQRFETMDQRFETIGQGFGAMDRRFQAMDRRFEAVEGQIAELRGEILGHFDELYRRLERIEQEYVTITQALRRMEAVLADERTRRDRLERDLATLRENVAVLTARIDDIDRRLSSS